VSRPYHYPMFEWFSPSSPCPPDINVAFGFRSSPCDIDVAPPPFGSCFGGRFGARLARAASTTQCTLVQLSTSWTGFQKCFRAAYRLGNPHGARVWREGGVDSHASPPRREPGERVADSERARRHILLPPPHSVRIHQTTCHRQVSFGKARARTIPGRPAPVTRPDALLRITGQPVQDAIALCLFGFPLDIRRSARQVNIATRDGDAVRLLRNLWVLLLTHVSPTR
jgi:hypothetical protein